MSRSFSVRPAAEADLQNTFQWYEDQVEGLGYRFIDQVDRVFERIQEYPLSAPILYREIRRVLLRQFPYGVFYVTGEEEIKIIAVSHHALDPSKWQDRY